MFKLAHTQPLAIGNVRAIYQHPTEPTLLIKVIRPEAIARRWGNTGLAPLKRRSRALQYTGFIRELKEYIVLQAQAPLASPLARLIGVVETDFGLGLLGEKVVGADGRLAPSLRTLCFDNGGLPDWTATALDALLDEVLRLNVIIGDMHAGNIVHGSDSRGGPRLLIVDGFGEKNVVPFNTLSRRRNAWNTRRLFKRLRDHLARPLEEWGPAREY